MKKTAVIFLAVCLLGGCVPLDRVNPTDPKASNFYGFEFTGNASESTLSAIGDFAYDGSALYIVDPVSDRAHKIGGGEVYSWSGGFTAPTGICYDGTYLFITDSHTYNLKIFNPSVSTVTTPVNFVTIAQQAGKIACDANYLYIASTTPASPVIRRYLKSAVLSAANGATVADDLNYDTTGIIEISDIEVHQSGTVVAADRGSRKLIKYNSSGAQSGSLQMNFIFSGFGLLGNLVYMPYSGGIAEADYTNGNVLNVFAYYGEGEGKIEAHAPAEAYGASIAAVKQNKISIFLKH